MSKVFYTCINENMVRTIINMYNRGLVNEYFCTDLPNDIGQILLDMDCHPNAVEIWVENIKKDPADWNGLLPTVYHEE